MSDFDEEMQARAQRLHDGEEVEIDPCDFDDLVEAYQTLFYSVKSFWLVKFCGFNIQIREVKQ